MSGSFRSWDDARRCGFVSAGGGEWYSGSLRALPVGGRVFVYVPKTGYVAVGMVAGPGVPFGDAVPTVGGEPRKMTELDLAAGYRHEGSGPDRDEYVVPIDWIKTLDRGQCHPREGPVRRPALRLQAAQQFHVRTQSSVTSIRIPIPAPPSRGGPWWGSGG